MTAAARTTKPRREDAGRWLSPREAADLLGCSRLALYERALSGEIKTMSASSRRYFDRKDVERAAAA